jgi:hypothetical protein
METITRVETRNILTAKSYENHSQCLFPHTPSYAEVAIRNFTIKFYKSFIRLYNNDKHCTYDIWHKCSRMLSVSADIYANVFL